MIRRLLTILVSILPVLFSGESSGKGNGGPSPAAMMQSQSHGGMGGGGRRYEDPRRAPPMDPERKINEQDCTRPIDLGAGNLRCKAPQTKPGNNTASDVLDRKG
jgi:hypothetical protein